MHGFLQDIGISFLIATIFGLIAQRIGQPIILGYIIAGVILGPEIGPQLISDAGNIEIISEIGLILLLFIIGLEMDLARIFRMGKQIIVTGIGQFILCVVYGIILFTLMGYSIKGNDLSGLYLALVCALSSTAIVVKLLYDKKELDTFPGRITLSVLIFQDIWAVIILAFQPNLNNPQISLFVRAILESFVLIGINFFLSKYVMSRIFQSVAKSPELIIVTSLGWCTFGAGMASLLGLSIEMGALISGVAISAFPYEIFVSARVLPLRDFFLTLFFVSLGMKIPHPTMPLMMTSLFLSVFIIFSRFFSVYPLLSFTGSGRRTAFISSLNLSQLSEFSLVIATLGVSFNHLDNKILSLFIYTLVITAVVSSYLIQFSHPLYLKFDSLLNAFGISDEKRTHFETKEKIEEHSIVLLGFHRAARAIIDTIATEYPELLKKILVIDFNPEVLKTLKEQEVKGVYGDISDLATLKHAGIGKAKIILSTIPDMLLKGTTNALLIKNSKVLNPDSYMVATADFSEQVDELYKAGANEVILPYSIAGKYIAQSIRERIDTL